MQSPSSEFAERYRALGSRDTRFDGQFIAGVRTTGIYCRPSCPARTPHPQNVDFYRTAAAAHEAGLRACKRCRPDAVPGSPDWNLSDDLASRAMRLIVDGVVEREGVGGLATRLGYAPRHVQRVLVAELGAGPLALARAHRAQSGYSLLISTGMPISDVAFAAGFSSIRQFNETVMAVYRSTPTELRASGRSRHQQPSSPDRSLITLRLPARAPFDGVGLMRFFADHAVAGLEAGDDDRFVRTIALPGGPADVEISLETDPSGSGVRCIARISRIADVAPLVNRIRRLFDLDADSIAIDGSLAGDPALAPLVQRLPGIRIPGVADADEALFRTLVGQQISVPAARTVLGRLVEQFSGPAGGARESPEGAGSAARRGRFPTATELAEHGSDVLRGPASRVRTIVGAAEAIADGRLALDVGMSTAELVASLTALPGIGPWTAKYVAMRVLGSPDILLDTDLIVLQSAAALGLPGAARQLAGYGSRWAPWRSYAGLHLWRARPAVARGGRAAGGVAADQAIRRQPPALDERQPVP